MTHNVCLICSVPGHYEQHPHIAMYQVKDLTTWFGVSILHQTNPNMHTTQATQHLATEQSITNNQNCQKF